MQTFFTIILDIIVPVFILICIGFTLHKVFNLDLYTLAKLNLYFVVPGIMFTKLYESDFSLELFLDVLFYFAVTSALIYALSYGIVKMFRFSSGKSKAVSNSTLFYNSGNYGVPVNDLVFKSDPFAMSIQIWVLAFQNLLTFSYGIFVLRSVEYGKLQAVLGYFKMPVFYALFLGITFNLTGVSMPGSLMVPLHYISDAMVAIALLTLGAQIGNLRFDFRQIAIYMSVALRLVMGPLLALIVIYFMGMDGIQAQALLISSAMPTSVNSAIIAQEYKNEPEFSAQLVLVSTLLSALTVTIVIYASGVLYG